MTKEASSAILWMQPTIISDRSDHHWKKPRVRAGHSENEVLRLTKTLRERYRFVDDFDEMEPFPVFR
jgi:hypothetical protein